MQKDFLELELSPAVVKVIAKAVEDCLGAEHAVTKAFSAVLNSMDRTRIEAARELFGTLPAGQQNMIWLSAKGHLASTMAGDTPAELSDTATQLSDTAYTAADLSPDRVLH